MEENWLHAVLITGLWTVSIGLFGLGAATRLEQLCEAALMLALVGTLPTYWLMHAARIRRERALWMDTIADSIARAVMEETRGLRQVK